MSTIVTQVDHRSFYTTLVPKTYQCYEARSISTSPLTTPALTESDQKPKHQKLHASSLPPPNRAEKAASAKTPLRAEAVGQTKPVESVPTIATDVLCGDVPKKSLRSEVFTPNVRRVLDYMADPTADEGHKEFHGVRPAEFRLIHEAGEAGRILTKPSQRTMPRSFDTPIRVGEHDWCHIQSVEYFVWVKGDHQDRIDVRNYDPQFMAHGTLAPNLNMDAVTAMLERVIPRAESPRSASTDKRKLRTLAEASDDSGYRQKGSQVLPKTYVVIYRHSGPDRLSKPASSGLLFYSVVYYQGLKARYRVVAVQVSFSRELSEDVDCSELENAEVRQPIVWRLGAKNVMKAADLTAHQRYDLWHDEVFKGVKRSHDESYEPTESECSSSDSEISATVSSQDSLAQSLAGFKCTCKHRSKRVKA
ncbi:hypothetical protein C8R48DRAFT_678736 [Suillus tomentosus]|nr:hypothetical protein C8R48DRAFT_678736 [Suillus tomentosus]